MSALGSDPIDRLVVESSGFTIRRSNWSSTPEDSPADLIQFAFHGKRGALKAEVTMDARTAEFYWRDLGELLGKDVNG